MDALILAGGKGTRLQAVVSDRPKPLAIVEDKPFIEHLIEQLDKSECFDRIIISCGHKVEMMHEWQQALGREDIILIAEDKPLGTGGAILHATREAKTKGSLLVMNGDSYLECDLPSLIAEHNDMSCTLTIAVSRTNDVSRFGEVKITHNQITAFTEKGGATHDGWINGGIYVLTPTILDLFPDGPSSFEKDMMPKLIPQGIGAFMTNGVFIDIGTPDSYQQAASVLGRRENV